MVKSRIMLLVAIFSPCTVHGRLVVGKHESERGVRNLTTRHNRETLEWNDDDDDDYVYYHPVVSFSTKSCKNLNKHPCKPSAMPTVSPTQSSEPTNSPSMTPTKLPTAAPTKIPTIRPSASPSASSIAFVVPTPSPTALPSDAAIIVTPNPTPSPTRVPTKHPSPSPTKSPTKAPTSPIANPTPMPTKNPTTSPTKDPTPNPTKSPTRVPTSPTPNPTAMPTKSPTKSPTKDPSPSPTSSPTRAPTRMPSKSPVDVPTTPSPTAAPNVPSDTPSTSPSTLIRISDLDDGIVTSCNNVPLDGRTKAQLLAVQYNMYIPPMADVANATSVMESRLHDGLVNEFLLCNFNDNPSFQVVSIASSPADTATNQACDTSNDPIPTEPTECIVVIAELSMTVLFPARRRQLQSTVADPAVLESMGNFFNESMAEKAYVGAGIIEVSFQGFVNVLDTATTAPDVNGVAGVVGDKSDDKNSKVAMGSAIVGSAALLLLLVTVFSVRRGRRHQEAYLKHLDDLGSTSEDDHSFASNALADGRVLLVREEEEYDDFFSVESGIEDELPATHPDVHYCASATCPICKHRVMGPTFLSTSLSEEDINDLSPRKSRLLNLDRHYMAPDTVRL